MERRRLENKKSAYKGKTFRGQENPSSDSDPSDNEVSCVFSTLEKDNTETLRQEDSASSISKDTLLPGRYSDTELVPPQPQRAGDTSTSVRLFDFKSVQPSFREFDIDFLFQNNSDSEENELSEEDVIDQSPDSVPQLPLLLLDMEGLQNQMAGIADQLQNIQGRNAQQDSNWLKPSVFSGSDDDVCQARSWIDKFAGFMELKGALPDGQVVRYLRLVTTGPAYQWALTLPNDANLANVRDAFLQRFVTANNLRYKLRHDFERRTQSDGEQVSKYLSDMQQMATALELDDNTVKHAIIRGLQPNIRSVVLTQEPENLDDAIRKAKIAALAVNPDFSSNAMKKFNTEGIDEMLKIMKQQHEDNVASQKSIQDLSGMLIEMLSQNKQERSSSQRIPSSNNATQGRCRYCNRPGHFIRECRVKARDDAFPRHGGSNGRHDNTRKPPAQSGSRPILGAGRHYRGNRPSGGPRPFAHREN